MQHTHLGLYCLCSSTTSKRYYLCIVMDLFSRKVIAWNISAKPDVDLVMTAFKKAYDKRNCPKGLMFHSDRGSSIYCFCIQAVIGFS